MPTAHVVESAGPAPRKRPQLKTKYTSYPSASHPTEEAGSDGGGGATVKDGVGEEGEEIGEAAVLNFYGGSESETGVVAEKVSVLDEIGAEIGTDSVASEHPGAEVELPCYAPEVCIEKVVWAMETEECGEKEVKEPPAPEVEPVTVEIRDVPIETESAPPTTDDVTEADIFGSTDEDTPSVEVVNKREGDGEKGGGEQTEQEQIKAVFQQAIETHTAAQIRKRPSSAVDYPSTAHKKRRIALPNAELYRQNSSSAVKRAPTITSNFSATLDKDSLYMGRKRMALKLTPVPSGSANSVPARPTLPLKANSKVPTKLRQRYLDSYIDEIIKVTLDPRQAYEKAEKEEAELFERCSSRMTYSSRATQTLQRLRREAREFLQIQREASDARVQAHIECGRSSDQATPTSGEPRDREKVANRCERGSEKLKKSKPGGQTLEASRSPTLLSPLLSPSYLSSGLVERCRSVEVRVRKCSVVASGSEEERAHETITISTTSDSDTAITAGSFYLPATSASSKPGRETAGKKKMKQKKVKGSEGKKGKSPVTESEKISLRDVGGLSQRMGEDNESLERDLFGDSDSDCLIVSSSCSSGEEEIMNISFEEALKGAELSQRRGRGKGRGGVKKSQTNKKKKTAVEGERVGGKDKRGGEGSGEKKEGKVAKPRLERRKSSSNSVDEPPVNFKPDSQSLVNLSAMATRANTSSLASLRLSNSVPRRVGRAPSKPPPPPNSSLVRPSCTVFKKAEVTLTAPIFYSLMKSYLMTQQQLAENGYPQPTSRGGVAAINWGGDPPPTIQPAGPNAKRHRCCRCGKSFIIYDDGQYQTVEDCLHHYGRLFKVKEYGEGVVSQYSCCNERRDSIGCQVAKFHVTAGDRPAEVSGYVQTTPSSLSSSHESVYALDCEMCYTTAGLELARVSVVDMNLQPVYEAIVVPPRPIVDYNTRFSGLTAEDFVSVSTTLEEVQRKLLDLVAVETILLGHSLESDLRALKVIHNRVVDTAIVFPHRRGSPLKRALRNLMKDHLNKIIQDDVDGGHDSLEDARACMELMLWKTRGDLQKTTRRVST